MRLEANQFYPLVLKYFHLTVPSFPKRILVLITPSKECMASCTDSNALSRSAFGGGS